MSERRATGMTPGEQIINSIPEKLFLDNKPVRAVAFRDVKAKLEDLSKLGGSSIRFDRADGSVLVPQWGPTVDPADPRLTSPHGPHLIQLNSNQKEGELKLYLLPRHPDIETAIRKASHIQRESKLGGEPYDAVMDSIEVYRSIIESLRKRDTSRQSRASIVQQAGELLFKSGFIRPRNEIVSEIVRELRDLRFEAIDLDSLGRINPFAKEAHFAKRLRDLMLRAFEMKQYVNKFSYVEFILRDERSFERFQLERMVFLVKEIQRREPGDPRAEELLKDAEEFSTAFFADDLIKVEPYAARAAVFGALTWGIQNSQQKARIAGFAGTGKNNWVNGDRVVNEISKASKKVDNSTGGVKGRLLTNVRLLEEALEIGKRNLPDVIPPSTKKKRGKV